MSLLISYQDVPGKAVYANLFSATNKIRAFNPSINNFANLSLSDQPDFAIPLSEDSIRKGYYSYIISNVSNIPATDNGDFYLVEVFESITGYNRESDPLLGTMAFYWDGNKEVDICGCQTQAGTSLTAQDIWSYVDRSLTEKIIDIDLECPDPYIIVNTTVDGFDELVSKIDNTDTKVNEIIRLINNLSPCKPGSMSSLPNTSIPIIGPRGSSGGTSSIRVR